MADEAGQPHLQGDENLVLTGNFFDVGSTTLEKIYRASGISDPRVANAANYWGIDYLKTGGLVSEPQIGMGHIFFTRPRLRLTYDNLLRHRTFTLLANGDPNSVAGIVRAYLDPVGHSSGTFECARVDKRNPFISVLTNRCENASGWRETPVTAYTSREGLMGESYSLADGKPTNYGSTSISASFKNMKNDFIGFLFHIWTQYMMLTHRGVMMPYKDDWLYNRINYNTRIYRFLTDPTGQYLVDFAMTGASFPLNSNKSGVYDYNRGERFQKNVDESSIEFQSNGTIMMDPIIPKQFNQTVLMFCPQMADAVRAKFFHELTLEEKPYFSHHAIPYVDLRNLKLGWYVDRTLYETEMTILGLTR